MIRMITYIKTIKITKIFKKSKNLGYYRYILNHFHLIDRSAVCVHKTGAGHVNVGNYVPQHVVLTSVRT